MVWDSNSRRYSRWHIGGKTRESTTEVQKNLYLYNTWVVEGQGEKNALTISDPENTIN